MENLRIPVLLPHNTNGRQLTPENHELTSDMEVTEPVEKQLASGVQNKGNILVSIKERSSGIVVEKREQNLEHSNKLPVIENTQLPSQNGSINVGNMALLTDSSSMNPGYEFQQKQRNAALDPSHWENENEETGAKSRNETAKKRNPLTSSRVLRTKSQEKIKISEPDNNVKEETATVKNRERARKKKKAKSSPVSEFSRTRTHLRYLLHRTKYEQNLIDVYTAEGWKGQSLEKLKPEKELQQAKSNILNYKLRIRDLFRHLDESFAVGKIPESMFDSVGEIDSEDIFCATCGSKDLSLENDIILCDGACERGFHQFCLKPPLLRSEIPPDDEGWLCPGCDCKVDCIDMLKDFQGKNLSITDSWENIFPEAAAAGKKMGDGFESSDDSDDDDYDPAKPEKVEKVQRNESNSEESNYFSAPDDLVAAPYDGKYMELPSDDSADNDFDPETPYQDKKVNQSSSSSDFTSDSEDPGVLLDDAAIPSKDSPPSSSKWPSMATEEENPKVNEMKGRSLKAELAYLLKNTDEPLSSKRHVERPDYKKLLEETYVNSSSDSSDEDFEDYAISKRQKTRREKTVMETYGNSSSDSSDEDFEDCVISKRQETRREKTVMVTPHKTPNVESKMDTSNADNEDQKESKCESKRNLRSLIGRRVNESSADAVSPSSGGERSTPGRFGEAVKQKLYESFKKSRYPKRDVRENLAKELGISFQQVTKWFDNARWSYNHRPQKESNTPVEVHEAPVLVITENTASNQVAELNQSNAILNQNHIPGATVDKLVTETGGGDSGIGKSRKRKGNKDQGSSTQGDSQSPQLSCPSSCTTDRRQTRSRKTLA